MACQNSACTGAPGMVAWAVVEAEVEEMMVVEVVGHLLSILELPYCFEENRGAGKEQLVVAVEYEEVYKTGQSQV